MQGITEAQAGWLRSKVVELPRSGNTILVTHQPNLSRAFPDWDRRWRMERRSLFARMVREESASSVESRSTIGHGCVDISKDGKAHS